MTNLIPDPQRVRAIARTAVALVTRDAVRRRLVEVALAEHGIDDHDLPTWGAYYDAAVIAVAESSAVATWADERASTFPAWSFRIADDGMTYTCRLCGYCCSKFSDDLAVIVANCEQHQRYFHPGRNPAARAQKEARPGRITARELVEAITRHPGWLDLPVHMLAMHDDAAWLNEVERDCFDVAEGPVLSLIAHTPAATEAPTTPTEEPDDSEEGDCNCDFTLDGLIDAAHRRRPGYDALLVGVEAVLLDHAGEIHGPGVDPNLAELAYRYLAVVGDAAPAEIRDAVAANAAEGDEDA